MKRIDIDNAIQMHTRWRRQFLNAFAGGNYVDMPLSEHRSCTLAATLNELQGSTATQQLAVVHGHFHALASEIVELSNNGLGDCADLLLPELNEASHLLVAELDNLRTLLDC